MSNQFANITGLTSEISARTVTKITTFNDSSQFSPNNWEDNWVKFQNILFSAAGSGRYFNNIARDYGSFGVESFYGSVMDLDCNIHFIPFKRSSGLKVDELGRFFNYSLVYTNPIGAYAGGVLAPNGDIHFVPTTAPVGQKVDKYGIVSTYVLAKQNVFSVLDSIGGDFVGGVLSPDGYIHFVPYLSSCGQRVNLSNGSCETYSIPGSSGGYAGGVLLPNGEIHFIRAISAKPGMKVVGNIATTYQIDSTNVSSTKGSKINLDGEASLYGMGAKILANGVINTVYKDFIGTNFSTFTYSSDGFTYMGSTLGIISVFDLDGNLIYSYSVNSSALTPTLITNPKGDIYFNNARGGYPGNIGKIIVSNGRLLPRNVYLSPYFNKSI